MAGHESDSAEAGRFQRGVRNAVANPGVAYRLLLYVAVVGVVVPFLFPLYWLLVVSVTPPDPTSVGLVPQAVSPASYLALLIPRGDQVTFLRYVFNSLVIASLTTAVVLGVSTLAGYVFGRLEFRGKTPLMLGTLAVSFFPPVSFLVPLFRLFTGNVSLLGVRSPDLFNTPWPMVLPLSALFMPLSIFVLTTFFAQVPEGLEDAARVEGATRLGALYRVVLPLAKPGLATAGVMTFVQTYNEFLYSFIMNNNTPENWGNITFALQNLQGTGWTFAAAGSVLALLPVAVLVLLANERLIEGVTAGAGRSGLQQ